jgi:FKBP-type peptidyl-prolyl cis-trans isomerase
MNWGFFYNNLKGGGNGFALQFYLYGLIFGDFMYRLMLFFVCCALMAGSLIAEDSFTAKSENNSDISYAMGVNLALQLKRAPVKLNIDEVLSGLKATYTGQKARISPEESHKLLSAYFKKVQAKQAAANQKMGQLNIKAGKEFLEANAKKPGVITTESGLQYKVLKKGAGAKPKAGSKVEVHYKGTLLDGTVFDSSYKRGRPITFPLKGVIKGWVEGLQLMNVGSKYILYVPSDLAYGKRAMGSKITPNSTLIFEVELLSIKDK